MSAAADATTNGVEQQQPLELPALIEGLHKIKGDSFASEGDRRQAASALSSALDEVELPIEKYLKLIWSNVCLGAILPVLSSAYFVQFCPRKLACLM